MGWKFLSLVYIRLILAVRKARILRIIVILISIIWVWVMRRWWDEIRNILTYSRIIYSLRHIIRRINILHRAMHILIWPTRVNYLPITITKWIGRNIRNTRTDHITFIKVAILSNSFLSFLWHHLHLFLWLVPFPTRLTTHSWALTSFVGSLIHCW